jgi:hypothetical protein
MQLGVFSHSGRPLRPAPGHGQLPPGFSLSLKGAMLEQLIRYAQQLGFAARPLRLELALGEVIAVFAVGGGIVQRSQKVYEFILEPLLGFAVRSGG